ncbi:hypothetical protein QLQ12_44440 [Actinoplanes sp. NEAU-A12]|uniref:Uncharacterized protein n=1 Tax=Actinoplanes sandaracinus TaxID=3045177 RepID=A0ABT6X0Y4_9ACTN|nr:hypothetical protein [Actinoplanes sandaracinus]MDI6105653.1 hypothetical protein [Actinoplanes sandaracinus]
MSTIDPEPAAGHAEPPYLFTTPGPDFGPMVTATANPDTALVESGVHGRWSRRRCTGC